MLSSHEKLAASQIKPKNLFGNIWTHDVAERLKIRRKAIADQSGMPDDWDVGSYPPYVTHKSGWLAGGLLALTAALAGAAGAHLLRQQIPTHQSESVVERTIEREIAVGIEIVPPQPPRTE